MARRIVLSTLGSLGDLHPLMGLALGLKSRGFETVMATSGFYRDRVEAAGLSFRPLRPLAAPDDPQMLRTVLNPRSGPEYLIRELLMPHLSEMYEDLLQATVGADFLISGEVVLAAPLVAEKRGLPWAAAILAPFSLFSAYDPSVFPFLQGLQVLTRAPPFVQRGFLQAAKFLTRDWGAPVARLRSSLGLRATRHPLLQDRFSPLLNLALFSPVLGRRQRDWPANTVQTGFVFFDQDPGAAARGDLASVEDFLATGASPVVFTLGSAAVGDPGRFYDDSAAAAHRIGKRALLLAGRNRLAGPDLPDALAVEYAPYSTVFPRSACVVHQGGVGTTAQALRAGKPQVVMPFAFDQPDNAARISRLGAGVCIPRHRYSIDRAARLLNRVFTEPLFGERARLAGEQVRREEGLARACDTVESAIRGELQS